MVLVFIELSTVPVEMLSAAGTLTCKPDVQSRYSPEADGQAQEIHLVMDSAFSRYPEREL